MINSIVGEAVNAAMENALYAPPPPPELGVVGARVFPEGTKKGELAPVDGLMEVIIDSKTYVRAPGMQIRNQRNMIVMPGTIRAETPVRYQLDSSGAVFRVWLLTRTEIAAP
ncbi:MAG: hypothetical protein H6943_03690 [Zoogloeaceae bacterium]|nr:hypothetical protein [Zoogloeaceae bacterium]